VAFSTDLLDAYLAQQRADNEAARQQLLKQALQWLTAHAAAYGIRQGYLFGSVTAAGRFQATSDIDLAIPTLSDGNPFGLIGALSLALNREVDLVALDQCHFADKIRQAGIAWNVGD
jgi:hypothetical protein